MGMDHYIYSMRGGDDRDDKNKAYKEISKIKKRIEDTVRLILRWGVFDGGHHKQWTMDQALRTLLDDDYDKTIKEFNEYVDEDGESYSDWDEGIAP